ncbi:hypothetical protein BABA_05666 [Neobacillus bataviensis LMG 21833]|uniref:Uncharacterized protein n=1 Tax=Neobacillus bataviensis LMG 21833 TaxID=1117379 RepID=K6EAE3_9BACI|nr:hypothetical protein [Neobacillus bataviensis]EKN70371.1 hypothetical protein BABA_05666 [Neobacillus bataviensis LMG 21833]
MLYVRHTVGSRLFYETTEYEIKPSDHGWEISFNTDNETAATLLKFHNELNIFYVEENQKTWFYSSEGIVEFLEDQSKLLIYADHKTAYPV